MPTNPQRMNDARHFQEGRLGACRAEVESILVHNAVCSARYSIHDVTHARQRQNVHATVNTSSFTIVSTWDRLARIIQWARHYMARVVGRWREFTYEEYRVKL
jgi:hypothetical protein